MFENLKFSLSILFALFFIQGCSNEKKTEQETPPTFTNQGHEIVYNMVEKLGNYNTLKKHKDVVYTYTYQTPDGKKDISTEKYIFEGELSYGHYLQHERTLEYLDGTIEQGYDGNEYWLKLNGEINQNEDALKKVKFNRPTNFYWFAMFQKLIDPGVIYEVLGEEIMNEQVYDIVKISFDTAEDEPSDIYQLYVNQQTNLVDQFLFTVVDYGVIDTPMLMQLEYEKIEDMLIPSKRQYKKSTWSAEISDDPWTLVNWTNIKFDNNLSLNEFEKK